MLVPLVVLAAGAIFAGMLGYNMFVGEGREHFWGEALSTASGKDTIELAHHVPLWVKLLPLVMGVSGLALSWVFYVKSPHLPNQVATSFQGLYQFSLNKWFFDELYDLIFVRPSLWLGRLLWKRGDGTIIDGFGPNGVAWVTVFLSRRASVVQSGFLYHYAFAMLIGLVALVSWYLFSRNG